MTYEHLIMGSSASHAPPNTESQNAELSSRALTPVAVDKSVLTPKIEWRSWGTTIARIRPFSHTAIQKGTSIRKKSRLLPNHSFAIARQPRIECLSDLSSCASRLANWHAL